MPEVSPLVVEGTPQPSQSDPENKKRQNPETIWRRDIKEAAKQQFLRTSSTGQDLILQVNIGPDYPQFTVEITFILNDPVGKGKDIDNLSKPVIDTLFYAPAPLTERYKALEPERKKPTGVLFPNISDTYVCHLIAHKRRPMPDEKERAIICLSWSEF